MTVWVVTKQWSEESTLRDYYEIIGIYSTEEKARAVQEELIDDNAADVLYLGADEIDVVIDEVEVE